MQKRPYLEGLRGILSLIVVIHHFMLLFQPLVFLGSDNPDDFKNKPFSPALLIANTPLNLFMNGNWAVCMFFVMSGYVLSVKYFRTANTFYLQQGALKRYFRLFLPVLGVCLFIYVLHAAGVFKNTFYPRNHADYSFGKMLFAAAPGFWQTLKIALIDVPLKGSPFILPVLWTITSEFLYSLLLFAFLLITHGFKKRWIVYLPLLVSIMYVSHNYGMLFFAGSIIALYEEPVAKALHNKALWLLLLLTALFLAGIPSLRPEIQVHTLYGFTANWPEHTGQYFRFASSIILFTLFLVSNTSQTLLSKKPFLFLGKISYSLYLLHLPLLFVIGSRLLSSSKGGLSPILAFVVCLAACAVAGFVFNKFVDEPSTRWADNFAKRFLNDKTKT